jgi:hypothetical protein
VPAGIISASPLEKISLLPSFADMRKVPLIALLLDLRRWSFGVSLSEKR